MRLPTMALLEIHFHIIAEAYLIGLYTSQSCHFGCCRLLLPFKDTVLLQKRRHVKGTIQ